MRQMIDQLIGSRLVQIKTFRRTVFSISDDPPDAAVLGSRNQRTDIQLLQVAGNGRIVLDCFPIHVYDVQRTVRTGRQIDRSEPLFGGREKLGLFVFAHPARAVADSIGDQQAAMDHVLSIVHAEVIAVEVGGKLGRLIDGWAAGRREVAVSRGFRFAVEPDPRRIARPRTAPWVRPAGRVHPRRMAIAGDIACHGRCGDVRIAGQVTMRNGNHVHRVLLVRAQIAISPVIHRLAETVRSANGRLQLASIRLEAEAD